MSLNKCRSTTALRSALRGLTPHIHLLRTTSISTRSLPRSLQMSTCPISLTRCGVPFAQYLRKVCWDYAGSERVIARGELSIQGASPTTAVSRVSTSCRTSLQCSQGMQVREANHRPASVLLHTGDLSLGFIFLPCYTNCNPLDDISHISNGIPRLGTQQKSSTKHTNVNVY